MESGTNMYNRIEKNIINRIISPSIRGSHYWYTTRFDWPYLAYFFKLVFYNEGRVILFIKFTDGKNLGKIIDTLR